MRIDIKFAGIAQFWNEEQAIKRNKLLQELGYLTKIIDYEQFSLIAYSHNSFTVLEAKQVLEEMQEDIE